MEIDNVTKEYKDFLTTYYFDYNLFDYIIDFLANRESNTHQSAYSIYQVMKIFMDDKKICIPFSAAHIEDILQGEKNLQSKKEIINEMTKGWYITEDKDNSDLVRVDKCLNVDQYFDEVMQIKKEQIKIQEFMNPIIESAFKVLMDNFEYEGIDENNIKKIKEYIEKAEIKSIYDLFQFVYYMSNILNSTTNNVDICQLTKNELSDVINKYLKSKWLSSMLKVYDIESFEEYFKNNTKGQYWSPFFSKIVCYSFLSDLIGLTKEKNKKILRPTFSSSMINDLLHLSYGIRCPVFVTNDNRLRLKAIFCKKMLDLPVKIFMMDNFYNYLVNTIVEFRYPDNDGKEFKMDIEIEGKKHSKIYTINLNKDFFD